MKKIAVILFNLGGPDSTEAIKPFLFNLFNDPAILNMPQPFRKLLATALAGKRAVAAEPIYAKMGGKSPILHFTMKQQYALEEELAEVAGEDYRFKVFIAMRYWYPFSREIVQHVKNYAPDEIILLPLYPQFSTTTTGSSLKDWREEAAKQQLMVPTKSVCCYYKEEHFITAHAKLLKPCYEEAKKAGNPRIIFSAHGLPQKVIDGGDPYQWQVEQTATAIIAALGEEKAPDWTVSYQSKVGPLKWLEPSTETALIQAGNDKVPVVVVPIAFVSEHSETLVELDIEYRELAEKHHVPAYIRVPALGEEPHFIQALRAICQKITALPTTQNTAVYCGNDNTTCGTCPGKFTECLGKRKN